MKEALSSAYPVNIFEVPDPNGEPLTFLYAVINQWIMKYCPNTSELCYFCETV